MITDSPRPSFHLEINSLPDFVAFVAIVRGTDLDTLAELTARLSKSNQALAAAETATEHTTASTLATDAATSTGGL